MPSRCKGANQNNAPGTPKELARPKPKNAAFQNRPLMISKSGSEGQNQAVPAAEGLAFIQCWSIGARTHVNAMATNRSRAIKCRSMAFSRRA